MNISSGISSQSLNRKSTSSSSLNQKDLHYKSISKDYSSQSPNYSPNMPHREAFFNSLPRKSSRSRCKGETGTDSGVGDEDMHERARDDLGITEISYFREMEVFHSPRGNNFVSVTTIVFYCWDVGK